MRSTQWHPAPDLPDLRPGVLDVWRAEVGGRDEARAILRSLLGRYLRVAPEAIAFVIGAHGKPALDAAPSAPLRFNMSHTRGLALYAVARDNEVGVDVERPRPGIDTVRLARRFITEPEADRLAALAPADRDVAFLRAWVRHEATVKCLGTGIGSARLSALAQEARPWLAELDPGDGAAAAVAATVCPETVRCWRWQGSAPTAAS